MDGSLQRFPSIRDNIIMYSENLLARYFILVQKAEFQKGSSLEGRIREISIIKCLVTPRYRLAEKMLNPFAF